MQLTTTIKWAGHLCFMYFGRYSTGSISIKLKDIDNLDPMAEVTAGSLYLPLQNDQTLIKNYSENEGILNVLVDNKVVSSPIGYYQPDNAFVSFPIVHVSSSIVYQLDKNKKYGDLFGRQLKLENKMA